MHRKRKFLKIFYHRGGISSRQGNYTDIPSKLKEKNLILQGKVLRLFGFWSIIKPSSKGGGGMDLQLDSSGVEGYHSGTQIARVLTERWMRENMYCPHCGNPHISQFENNRPVADFYCPACRNEYELKSKNGNLGNKITDGAYETMIARITGNQNPDFLFMSYAKADCRVRNLILVPKHFFVPAVIERRKPLPPTAHRAGWVGCNILIGQIPQQGRISIVSNGCVADAAAVIRSVNASRRLETGDLNCRGWLMDVLNCVNNLPQVFSLEEMYRFEEMLQHHHPDNHNIRPKIRQQLQLLRDRGFVEFLGNGSYRRLA